MRPRSALVLLALLLSAGPAPRATAQQEAERGTRFERELARPGRLLIERRRALSPVKLAADVSLVVTAVRAAEPGREEERVLGVAVELRGAGNHVVNLDLYEIDGLVRGIDYLSHQLKRGEIQGEEAVELRITSVDGLSLGAVVEAGRARRFVRVADSLRLTITRDALAQLRERLDRARRLLFEN